MTTPPDDLESRIDAAFSSAQPRAGFAAELWGRIEARKKRPGRWTGWLGGFRGFDLAPALAALAVVALAGLGIYGLGHISPRSAGSGASTAAAPPQDRVIPNAQQPGLAGAQGQFGRLPVPALSNPRASGLSTETGAIPYFDAADLSWTGSLPALPAVLPVYRYSEPQKADLDGFAAKLGGTPTATPATYQGPDFSLAFFASAPANGREPLYDYITKSPDTTLNPVAGDVAEKAAADFLAAKNLTPGWDGFKVTARSFNGLALVTYVREFQVPGVAQPAIQVDASGTQVGLNVRVRSDATVFEASGPLPVSFDTGQYRVLSAAGVLQQVQQASSSGGPHVNLTRADLVYEALGDGDHGYYVPALLLTGVFDQGGQRYEKRLLVQVLDPSGLR